MAIGFTPKYSEALPLNDLTPDEFLAVAMEAIRKLNWKIGHTTNTGFVAFTSISLSSWGEKVSLMINGNSAELNSECTGSQFVDWGKNEANVKTFIATINEVRTSFSPEELAQKTAKLPIDLIGPEEGNLSQPQETAKQKITNLLSIFKPAHGYVITPILINLNIIIFVAMILSGVHLVQPDGESLIRWGANFRPATLEGGWWRLITSCFLHIGIMHLLLNMYALIYIGVLLEPHLGKVKFLTAYLLSGIAASIASLWWNSLTISAGASGAIFGMYGVFLAMLTTNLIEKSERKALLLSTAVFVGYNLLYGLTGGIDNAAHIGGLLGGLIIGYAFIPSLKNREEFKLKYSTVGLLVLIILLSSFAAYKSIRNDVGIYEDRMKAFVSMEAMALEVYKLPQGTPKTELLFGLDDRGIYYWNENIKVIESFKDLDLPDVIRARNDRLKDYCKLRIKAYQLHYKSVAEDTEKYKEEIESYNKKIEKIIKELGGGQAAD